MTPAERLAATLTALNALDSATATRPLFISCGCVWEDNQRTRTCPAHNRPRH